MLETTHARPPHRAPGDRRPGPRAALDARRQGWIVTAYSTSSRIWFTTAAGIVTEVYYPTIDHPQIRDLQLLVTDGRSFLHDEKNELVTTIEDLSHQGSGLKITNVRSPGPLPDREGGPRRPAPGVPPHARPARAHGRLRRPSPRLRPLRPSPRRERLGEQRQRRRLRRPRGADGAQGRGAGSRSEPRPPFSRGRSASSGRPTAGRTSRRTSSSRAPSTARPTATLPSPGRSISRRRARSRSGSPSAIVSTTRR